MEYKILFVHELLCVCMDSQANQKAINKLSCCKNSDCINTLCYLNTFFPHRCLSSWKSEGKGKLILSWNSPSTSLMNRGYHCNKKWMTTSNCTRYIIIPPLARAPFHICLLAKECLQTCWETLHVAGESRYTFSLHMAWSHMTLV